MLSLFHTFYFQLCLVSLSLFHTLVDLNCDVVTISYLLFSAMSGVSVPVHTLVDLNCDAVTISHLFSAMSGVSVPVSHPGRSEL